MPSAAALYFIEYASFSSIVATFVTSHLGYLADWDSPPVPQIDELTRPPKTPDNSATPPSRGRKPNAMRPNKANGIARCISASAEWSMPWWKLSTPPRRHAGLGSEAAGRLRPHRASTDRAQGDARAAVRPAAAVAAARGWWLRPRRGWRRGCRRKRHGTAEVTGVDPPCA